MDDVDLRGYLLALTTKGQESFRGVLKRDRTIRKAFPADTLETAAWSEVVDALMLIPTSNVGRCGWSYAYSRSPGESES